MPDFEFTYPILDEAEAIVRGEEARFVEAALRKSRRQQVVKNLLSSIIETGGTIARAYGFDDSGQPHPEGFDKGSV